MKLITSEIKKQLLQNGEFARKGGDNSMAAAKLQPALKLFHAMAECCWLITEMNPDDHDELFGLCDCGLGYPELGYVHISELETIKVMGMGIERDMYWEADDTLDGYTKRAKDAESIRAIL